VVNVFINEISGDVIFIYDVLWEQNDVVARYIYSSYNAYI